MRTTDKVTFEKIEQHIDIETGNIIGEKRITKIKAGQEPNYIKLYIDCLLSFKELSKNLNPILVAFLKHMSYASVEDGNGGQIIYVNAMMKKGIASNLDLSVESINKALTKFVKTGIFKRIGVGTYQVNPSLFGKGDWTDIKAIRATFDFNTGDIEADIK